MGRGAWLATVHRVVKSWTQLKQLSMHIPTITLILRLILIIILRVVACGTQSSFIQFTVFLCGDIRERSTSAVY